MAVDYSTDVGRVRALIPDTEEVDWEDNGNPAYIFADAQIQAFLDIHASNVKRAASAAVGALSVSEAYISKVIKTEDLQTDGAKVAAALAGRARDLRREADEDEDAEFGTYTEIVPFFPRPPHCGPR